MSFPKIAHPTFNVEIPSSKRKVRMRPFLVREEKILLMAQTSENAKDIVLAIQQVVNNCFVDDVDLDDLTTFDIEYLFLKLRAKSVGNVIEMKYRDPEDGLQYDISIDLDDVQMKFTEGHNTKIEITPESGIILKYPKADMTESISPDVSTEVELMFELMKYCIDKIYDADNVYNANEGTKEDLNEFVDNLDVSTMKKIQEFMETMPKLYHEASYFTKEGTEKKVVLQTLNDFFTLR